MAETGRQASSTTSFELRYLCFSVLQCSRDLSHGEGRLSTRRALASNEKLIRTSAGPGSRLLPKELSFCLRLPRLRTVRSRWVSTPLLPVFSEEWEEVSSRRTRQWDSARP